MARALEALRIILPVLLLLLGILCRRKQLITREGVNALKTVAVSIALPAVLPVFADDENQRGYVSSVLTLSTLTAILGFALQAWIYS